MNSESYILKTLREDITQNGLQLRAIIQVRTSRKYQFGSQFGTRSYLPFSGHLRVRRTDERPLRFERRGTLKNRDAEKTRWEIRRHSQGERRQRTAEGGYLATGPVVEVDRGAFWELSNCRARFQVDAGFQEGQCQFHVGDTEEKEGRTDDLLRGR